MWFTYRLLCDVLGWESLFCGREGAHGIVLAAPVALHFIVDRLMVESLGLKLKILREILIPEDDVIRVQLLIGVEPIQVGVDLERLPVVCHGGLCGTFLELIVIVIYLDGAMCAHVLGAGVEMVIVI